MTTRAARILENQNINVHANGAGTVSGKADLAGQKKARAGGRKPLGDLSNALDGSLNKGNPSVSKASKLLMSKNLESDKRISGKASKKSLTGSRKALSDISNSGKPNVPEIKSKNTLKPSLLIGESFHPCAIAEEQILHDHRICIKSQFETADAHQFFKTVGLEDDSDDPMPISFELSAISKRKSESGSLELEEVPERLPEKQFLSVLHGSPSTHCKTPSLSNYRTLWNDSAVNFKLIDTPKLFKN
ncbi:hypothetical protein Fmac_023620 [Flemingia macrophylla]|uniref:Uncharacterized protein n=1 Tax=Flemingia macrophylla TaxID=520843 RepID=A0ABD1LM20_9FABA